VPTKSKDMLSPIERFSKVDVKPQVKVSHTFVSPCYVLDSKLQQNKHINKWSNQARVGMYLGMSPRHSRRVVLVLSLQTGLVSPQMHCKFDDLCDTLKTSSGNRFPRSQWQANAGFREDKDVSKAVTFDRDLNVESTADRNDQQVVAVDQDIDPLNGQEGQYLIYPDVNDGYYRVITRYGRIIQQPKRFGFDDHALTVAWDVFHDDCYLIQEEMNDPIAFHPHAFAASSNPGILYLQEAQAADDGPQFREAMAKEIESHEEMDHWELVRRDALPPKTKVLPAVWAMH